MTTFEQTKEKLKDLSLDELLEEISVLEYGFWENQNSKVLVGWWAVTSHLGIIAYFGN